MTKKMVLTVFMVFLSTLILQGNLEAKSFKATPDYVTAVWKNGKLHVNAYGKTVCPKPDKSKIIQVRGMGESPIFYLKLFCGKCTVIESYQVGGNFSSANPPKDVIFQTRDGEKKYPVKIVNPYANSAYAPPKSYKGPVFNLSYDYPRRKPASIKNPPWIRALNGKGISQDNALDYVKAVKAYIAKDMRTLILNYPKWNADKAKWYNLPWLFNVREPIHGAYIGSQFPHNMFPLSGLKKGMTTYVLVYYNDIAAYTLGQLWGDDAMNPDLKNNQFLDGAIIIKACFTTALADDWSPMEGAAKWTLYGPPHSAELGNPELFEASFFQFDIIVKDSKTAPQTSWVFSTLIYDKNAEGDAWDRMIPLGAMWGNDPEIYSAVQPNAILKQNVINPMAPLYATETLGYGGRLAGPNDGAVVQDAIIDGKIAPRIRVSSCMSCHGTSEWPMKSFLLPGPMPSTSSNFTQIYQPATHEFDKWFQDRPGYVPQDTGTIPFDYDLNITFKALPAWAKYMKEINSHHPYLKMLEKVSPHMKILLENPEKTSKTGHLFKDNIK